MQLAYSKIQNRGFEYMKIEEKQMFYVHLTFPATTYILNYHYIIKCQNCAYDYIALTQRHVRLHYKKHAHNEIVGILKKWCLGMDCGFCLFTWVLFFIFFFQLV